MDRWLRVHDTVMNTQDIIKIVKTGNVVQVDMTYGYFTKIECTDEKAAEDMLKAILEGLEKI